MWMIATFFFNEETGRVSMVVQVVIALIFIAIGMIYLIWFNQGRVWKLIPTDQIVDLQSSLRKEDIHRILRRHKIPVNMKFLPILKRDLGGDSILKMIVDRLRIHFSVGPDARLECRHFRGMHENRYSSEGAISFDVGCRFYVEALEKAGRISIYPDIPCVVCHLRKQDNPYSDEFKLCFRSGEACCYVGGFLLVCSPEVTALRKDEARKAEIAKEKAIYGSDGYAILQAARAAADHAKESTPRSKHSLIAWAVVTAEIKGCDVRWQSEGEQPRVNAGAVAFSKVLKEHDIVSSIRRGLD